MSVELRVCRGCGMLNVQPRECPDDLVIESPACPDCINPATIPAWLAARADRLCADAHWWRGHPTHAETLQDRALAILSEFTR
jgi:hypothetical protein